MLSRDGSKIIIAVRNHVITLTLEENKSRTVTIDGNEHPKLLANPGVFIVGGTAYIPAVDFREILQGAGMPIELKLDRQPPGTFEICSKDISETLIVTPNIITRARINPRDGAQMIYIPAGQFTMGCDQSKEDDAKPQHSVELGGYWIYRHEVTVAQYRKFCLATGRLLPPAHTRWTLSDNQPVVNVSWNDARAYSEWAGVRLPTEAEWEKAARGSDGRPFPWGHTWHPEWCNIKGNSGQVVLVDDLPNGASPFSVYNMIGNVAEWCDDLYKPYESSEQSDLSALQKRAVRGGSWCNDSAFYCYFRRVKNTDKYETFIGFRCAASAVTLYDETGVLKRTDMPRDPLDARIGFRINNAPIEWNPIKREAVLALPSENVRLQVFASLENCAPYEKVYDINPVSFGGTKALDTITLRKALSINVKEWSKNSGVWVNGEYRGNTGQFTEIILDRPVYVSSITLVKTGYEPYTLDIPKDDINPWEPSMTLWGPSLKPLDWINPKDGADLVYVPGGEFEMGIDHSDLDMSPRHLVRLTDYWIYKHEVTVKQYRQFCEAKGREMPKQPDWSTDQHPVVNVSWDDARDYAEWAGGMLPTEAEWEKAARGTDGRLFPWGNDWDAKKCTVNAVGASLMPVGTMTVGESPYGALDMAGNAAEWCRDWYDSQYYVALFFSPVVCENPSGPVNGTRRVIRGGVCSRRATGDYLSNYLTLYRRRCQHS